MFLQAIDLNDPKSYPTVRPLLMTGYPTAEAAGSTYPPTQAPYTSTGKDSNTANDRTSYVPFIIIAVVLICIIIMLLICYYRQIVDYCCGGSDVPVAQTTDTAPFVAYTATNSHPTQQTHFVQPGTQMASTGQTQVVTAHR